MVHLVDALVHQQHGLVVGREQARREGALAEGHGAALDREAGVDASLDLERGHGGAGWEEVGSDFVGGGGCEGCF